MLQCKGPIRSWYLQMATEMYFHGSDHKYNYSDPKWFITYVAPDKRLQSETDDVFDLMCSAGAMIQEVFGLNYLDIISMDLYTYSRFKKRVLEVYEKRVKDQQEQEEEAERQRKEEERARMREEQRNRSNRNRDYE